MTEDLLKEYIRSSWQLLQDHPQAGRYFHELTNRDNSPVVVHRHTNQLTYVLSGSGKAYLNGAEQPIAEGSALFVPAGTTHRFVTDEKMKLFHIHIPDDGRETDRQIVEGNDYERYVPE